MKLVGINFPFWSVTTAFRPLGISENGHNIDLYHDLAKSELEKVNYYKTLKIVEDILIGFWFFRPINKGSLNYESYTLAHSYFFQESENIKKIIEFISFLISKYEFDWDVEKMKGIKKGRDYKSIIDKIFVLLLHFNEFNPIKDNNNNEITKYVNSLVKKLLKKLTFQDNKLYLRSSIELENDIRKDSGEI